MNAERYVRQVEKLDKLIHNKKIEKEQWQEMAMNSSSVNDGDRVKATANQQKMADAVHHMVDIEREIDDAIEVFANIKMEVISTIEMLDAVEYDILHKIYIQYIDIADVADEYGKSYTWANAKRNIALKQIQKILDERGKNDPYCDDNCSTFNWIRSRFNQCH